jgi:branched-chain amino acid transport system substrate-binding protein
MHGPIQLVTRALACIVGSALLGLSGCSSSVPDTLKIGVAVPLSGPTGARGQDLLNGAMLAAEELNAKGVTVDGKSVKIEIVQKDDKGDAATTKQVAQELVDENVHAVIGHVYTAQTMLAVPIYAAKGIPNFFTSTAPGLLELGKGNAFRLSAHDGIQARALASFATENLHGRRLVALVESSDYGKGMFEGCNAALKDKSMLLLRVDVKVGEPLSAEQAAQVAAAKPDVVIAMVSRESQSVALMSKLKGLGYTNYALIGVNGTKTPSFARTDIDVNGIYVTATTIDVGETADGREFAARFKARFKSDPVWGAHYAYDAVFLVTNALKHSRSARPADLVADLKKYEARAPVNGQIRFAESGEQRYPDIGVYKADRGAWIPQTRSSAW